MSLKWHGNKIKQAVKEGKKTGLTKSAIVVHGQAVLLAGVDLGLLRNSISWSVGGKVDGLNSHGGINKASPSDGVTPNNNEEEAVIGTNVVYAPVQEYKHNPFLRPAIDYNQDNIKNIIGKEIADAVKRAGG
ncbi:hypothetical protein SAMN05446037_100267 [Anaerovirgula multivorans]|uniref:Phage protein, HK97 gp10 family n=1 Tax=Anaerovirgula multivorans TaxID=312168 RepID=A0A239AJD4_9FIRM|nr:hypothetical protein [Anaerovirgula multivorans]SNR95491.1 hypothetical protein SAMN05446037_100267 [Anaerovirgula multivorans]